MDYAAIFKALGDPTRFSIYQEILLRRHCVRSMSKKLGITESAVSQHMKVLRETGLVYGEKYGYHMHYLPAQETLDQLSYFVAGMKKQSRELDRDTGKCQCEFREVQDQ